MSITLHHFNVKDMGTGKTFVNWQAGLDIYLFFHKYTLVSESNSKSQIKGILIAFLEGVKNPRGLYFL